MSIESRSSPIHPLLELILHRNQWKLATQDAWYSDGRKYRPLKTAFKLVKHDLRKVDNVLVLGAGIGSAVYILDHMGFHPTYTLVDLDEEILQLAIELLPPRSLARIEPVCMDAEMFVQNLAARYELVVCDVFIGRTVPQFVCSSLFLAQCKRAVVPGGYFILNYIRRTETEFNCLANTIHEVFGACQLIELGINKIFVAPIERYRV